ncbi:MAG: helix-turn-helix transcriptional regulator [Clostridia bacterium]|nr:helix-turn-helix transcriptional regulator [Clostridia bacterium]
MEKEFISFEEIDLPIKLYDLKMHQGGDYRGMHSHAAVEVVEVKSGDFFCYVNEDKIRLQPGEIIFINSNTGHRLSSENAEITYMYIDVRFSKGTVSEREFSKLYDFISETQAMPYLIFSGNTEIQEILHKIYTRYYESQRNNRWYLKAYIYELVAFMYSQSFITPITVSAERIKKIELIVRYIDMNFRSPITLDEISAAVNYNRYAVCHYFKSITGATVFEYINFLRVHFAIEMLKQKNNSILEIATNSGFSSPTYFNRVFKSIIGCSPSVYRKFFNENTAST